MKTSLILAAALAANWFAAGAPAADAIAARREFRTAIAANPARATAYLADPDAEIRRYAVYVLAKTSGEKALEHFEKALQDPDENVRLTAAGALSGINTPRTRAMLKAAANDSSNAVRQIAVKASWPFHRDIKLLRLDPSWDYDVTVVKSIPIPAAAWKFRTDPRQVGHRENWFAANFDDSAWSPIKLGFWESQGFPDYDGVGWYRIKFTMPEKIVSNAVEIAFAGVDESAWVWLNGIYLGCHDLGMAGHNQPFAVDCRSEIRWGAENTLVVRVLDTGFAGGIWKPIHIEVLK